MSTVNVNKDVVARSFSDIPATFDLPARKEGEGNAKYLARASMNSYKNAGKDIANAVLAGLNAVPVAEVEAIAGLPNALRSLATGIKAESFHAAANALEGVIKQSGATVPVSTVRAIEDHAIGDGLRIKAQGQRAMLRDSGVRLVKGAGFVVTDALSTVGHTVQGSALLVGAGLAVLANGVNYMVHALYEGLVCVGIVARKIEKDIEKGVEIVAEDIEKAAVFVGEEAIKAGKAIEQGVEIVAHDAVEAGKFVAHEVKEGAEAVGEAISDTAHDVAVGARKATSAVAKKIASDASELAKDASSVAKDLDSKDNTLRDPLKRGA